MFYCVGEQSEPKNMKFLPSQILMYYCSGSKASHKLKKNTELPIDKCKPKNVK